MSNARVTKKQKRINNANENYKSREQRSAEEQLALLDSRLGKNIGAQKERAKLLLQVEDKQ